MGLFKVLSDFSRNISTKKHKRNLLHLLKRAPENALIKEKILWLRELTALLRSQDQFKLFIDVLKENPVIKKTFSRIVSSIAGNVDPLDFFCDAGVIDSHSFLRELLARISIRFLPKYRDYSKLSVVAEDLLQEEGLITNLKTLNGETLTALLEVVQLDGSFLDEIYKRNLVSLDFAQRILAARIASLSSASDFRDRLSTDERLLLLDLMEHRSLEVLDGCRQVIDHVHQSLEQSGVSIELVFLLERMKSLIERLQQLALVSSPHMSFQNALSLIEHIRGEQRRKNSITGLLSVNLRLLSKKIVERAGVTGEHYIARTPKESRSLFVSAAGGGLLTVGTTIFKSGITKLGLPLFVEGSLVWINYSTSFILMQFMHLTLATKTPAMTASVLAEKLKNSSGGNGLAEFADEVIHLLRSSFLGVLGNVIFVIFGAVLFDLALGAFGKGHVLTSENAVYYLKAHHPLSSLTILYALYTGGALWLGSAIGGWFENWYVFRKLPQAIKESSSLRRIVGTRLTKKVSDWTSGHIMGLATNIALGFLLAFSTIFGKFFGIPLDVRHVTLSSGILGFSFMGLENIKDNISLVLFAATSIVLIGFLNFSVSFIISIILAVEARGISLREYPNLFRYVINRILKR